VSFDPHAIVNFDKYWPGWKDQLYNTSYPERDYAIYARDMHWQEKEERMGYRNDDWEGTTILPATREPGYWLNMDVRVSWEIGPGQKESTKKKRFGNDRLVYFWRVFAGAEAETRDQKKVIFEGVSNTMTQAESEVKAAVRQTERLVALNRQGSTGLVLEDDEKEEE